VVAFRGSSEDLGRLPAKMRILPAFSQLKWGWKMMEHCHAMVLFTDKGGVSILPHYKGM